MVKTFALDRISDLDITSKKFKPDPYNAAEVFRNSFGIISPDGDPHEIILWFDGHQGNYIKSMPMHHSQQIIEDGENGLTVKLFLVPTYDFKQAILSYGDRVKLKEPKFLKKELKAEAQRMVLNYS